LDAAAACGFGDLRETLLVGPRQRLGLLAHVDQRADGADHRQDAGNIALVEGMNRDALPDQLHGDLGPAGPRR